MDTARSSDEIIGVFENFDANYPANLENCQDVDGRGWLVADQCTVQDYKLFEEFLGRRRNNIPRKVKLSYFDGKIFIKRLPGNPHEECAAGVVAQLTIGLNNRICTPNKAIFKSGGSADHRLGADRFAQPDVSVYRFPNRCTNFCAEISSTGTTTRNLVRQCRDYFHCPGIQYVLGIDVWSFVGTDRADKQVRIFAHLFERGVNDDQAPMMIISFGNAPMTHEAGAAVRNHLIQHYYPGYPGNQIIFRGVGFDTDAPPCDAPNIPYYRLHLNPNLMLLNDDGVVDYHGVHAGHIGRLHEIFWIDLFLTQARIRYGFFHNDTFPPPVDAEVLAALSLPHA